jgi:hypothetical protein
MLARLNLERMDDVLRRWVWIGFLAVSCARARASEAPTSAPVESQEAAPAAPEPAPATPAPAGLGPTDAATTEYQTLAEAEGALEKAKAEIDRLAFAQPPSTSAEAAPSKKEAADKGAEAPGAQKAESGCNTACRAFASLLRAANAVCRLDAEGGDRCSRAKLVVSDAERRVSSCGCPR